MNTNTFTMLHLKFYIFFLILLHSYVDLVLLYISDFLKILNFTSIRVPDIFGMIEF